MSRESIQQALNSQIQGNMFLKDLKFILAPPRQVGVSGGAKDGLETEIKESLVETLATDFKNSKSNAEELRKFRIRYENDPVMAPSNDEVTSTDRVIFIAITFLFRGISLFLTEWALNSYMFNGFQSAIGWYCMVYLSLFLLLTFLVNATKEIQLFRMTFYYLSFTPNSFGRVFIHCLVLLMLIPIPFLVKERIPGMEEDESEQEDNTFTKRRAIIRVLSNLTFFIWILTSAIALRY